MPDDNKFDKLREMHYRIPGLCGYCTHGEFPSSEWGTCKLHRYEHKKHDNPDGGRGVSIHVTGTCPSFEVDYGKLGKSALGAHMEFFDGEPGQGHGPTHGS